MNKVIVFAIINIFYNNTVTYSYETNDSEIWDFQKFRVYQKFIPESSFSSTKVKADIKLYNAGLSNEDVFLNVTQLIRKYGYVAEEHKVKTEDGYVLTMVRIPNEGPVVLLMHGLFMSADDWVTAGPETGIAYLLAKEGYDVWMGNARGNKHSRKHESLLPTTFEFWNFSWDEIGRYDLPAMIDYMLHLRNHSQLFYVGHSQGSTAFFVMCSEIPKYNDKISLMVALSAPTAIPNIKSPFINFLKFITLYHPELLFALAKELGIYEFSPSPALLQNFRIDVCGKVELAEIICSNMVFVVCGFNAAQINVTNLPVIFSHTPSGASTKQVEHYSQTVLTGKFRRFDYGEVKNLEIYGSKMPPEYNLKKTTAPVAIFHSDNDWLVSFEDVHPLRQKLKNVVDFYTISDQYFNHADYMYAKDLKQLVFVKLLSLIKEFQAFL